MKFEEITELEAQTFKQAACDLAQLDGKEPLAIANTGVEEWRSYVPEIKRHAIIRRRLAEAESAIERMLAPLGLTAIRESPKSDSVNVS